MSENLIRNLFLPAFFLLSLSLPLHADEIFLKEGKIVRGHITNEDEREFTILLGSNMMLRVNKDKVSKVVRAPKAPKSNRPIIRTAPSAVHSSSSTASVTPSSGAAIKPLEITAVKAVVPVSTPPLPLKSGIERTSIKKDSVVLEQTIITSTKDVHWALSWEGAAEKENTQSKWKWAVVRASITTKTDDFSQGQMAIYQTSALSFTEQLSTLRSKDEVSLRLESERLSQEIKDQANKKQEGYNRRHSKDR